jgi:hypothetical protein
LLKYAGTDAFFDIASAAGFEDDGFNVFKVQQVREQQPSWPGTDNAHLCSHCSHFRRMASSLLDLQRLPVLIVSPDYRPVRAAARVANID